MRVTFRGHVFVTDVCTVRRNDGQLDVLSVPPGYWVGWSRATAAMGYNRRREAACEWAVNRAVDYIEFWSWRNAR